MLVLREAQVEALADAGLQRFEQTLYQQVLQSWPARCRRLGKDAVLASVREGVRRASTYGIVDPRSTGRFVFLMYALGFDFDTSDRTPWAGSILATPGAPAQRVEALWQRALEHLSDR